MNAAARRIDDEGGVSSAIDALARENTIGVVDLDRFVVAKRLPTETKPDGIAYAAPFRKAYVSNERARASSIRGPTRS